MAMDNSGSKKFLNGFGKVFYVSSRGTSNGLSNYTNDGADFGPDTAGTTTCGIQEAINAGAAYTTFGTSATGGATIELLDGRFNITSGITITAWNLCLKGQGWQTQIYNNKGAVANSFDIITVGNGATLYRNIIIRDFQLFGGGRNLSPNVGTGNAINMNTNVERTYVINLFIYTAGASGILMTACSDNFVIGCYFENGSGNGITLTGGGDNHIKECEFDTQSNAGIQVYDDNGDTITGCVFFGNLNQGVNVQGSKQLTISGNQFHSDGQTTATYPEISLDSDGVSTYAGFVSIVGNTFWYDTVVSTNTVTFGIQETSSSVNNNYIAGNTFSLKAGIKSFSLAGANTKCLDVALPFRGMVAAPSSTTSTTGLMMGLGATFTITPVATGRIRIRLHGQYQTATGLATVTLTAKYGTGTAPVNGAAATGTTFDTAQTLEGPATATSGTFILEDEITGSTLGTALWFDIELATGNASDAASIKNIYAIIEEVEKI